MQFHQGDGCRNGGGDGILSNLETHRRHEELLFSSIGRGALEMMNTELAGNDLGEMRERTYQCYSAENTAHANRIEFRWGRV